MRQITEYLSNKIVNSQIMIDSELNSQVTNNPIEITDKSYMVYSYNWKQNRISIFIEYVTEILKKELLTNEYDIDFAKHWLTLAKDAYNRIYVRFPKDRNIDKIDNQQKAFMYLFNGYRPYFGYAKFTFDVLKYALSKPNLTKPRKQKLEKMLRECYQDVETNKDSMNWYNL